MTVFPVAAPLKAANRLLCLTMLLVGSMSAARADANNSKSQTVWHKEDSCSQEAFKKYPDYTREGNAKREAWRRKCLRDNRLPAPEGPPPSSR